MKIVNIKISLFVFLLTLLVIIPIYSFCPSKAPYYEGKVCVSNILNSLQEEKILIQVTWQLIGLGGSEGKYIYIKIYKSGNYEFQDRIVSRNKAEFPLIKGRLPSSEIKKLFNYLNSKEVTLFKQNYESARAIIDSFTVLEVDYLSREKKKSVTIINYDPALSGKRLYPRALVSFMCRIEKLRRKAFFAINDSAKVQCLRKNL
jgi:hypothetical protein